MRLGIVQMASTTDPEKNLAISDALLERVFRMEPDLVVFPEYQMMMPDYTSPDASRRMFQTVSESFVTHFMKISEDHGKAIALNIAERGWDGLFNSAIVVLGDRIIYSYRKINLFDAYGFRESLIYKRGDTIPDPFTISGLRVSIFICYDLRFPQLPAVAADRGADLMIYQAGWYRGRYKVRQWKALLAARAIENGSFVAGVSNCNSAFIGRSTVFDPDSRPLGSLDGRPGILTVDLEMETLETYRRRVPLREQRKIHVRNIS